MGGYQIKDAVLDCCHSNGNSNLPNRRRRSSPIRLVAQLLSALMTLQELKTLDWESLPESWPEWVVAIREARQGCEALLGRSLTPQEVFDLEFDKDAKAEIEAQE